MPRLNEYISVGFCSGYGDGDFRVSMAVKNLSPAAFNELKLAVLSAVRCAEDHWRDGQNEKKQREAAAKVCEEAQRLGLE